MNIKQTIEADLLEKAREFYQTVVDPNADDPAMYLFMRDFASEAVAEERRRIAADLCLFRPDVELKAVAAFNRYIDQLRQGGTNVE